MNNILLAIPNLGWNRSALTQWIADNVRKFPNLHVDCTHIDRPTDSNCNRITKDFLENTDHDNLLIMGDDILPYPELFHTLQQHADKDIVCNAVLIWKKEERRVRPHAYRWDGKRYQYLLDGIKDAVDPVEGDFTGSGVMMIHRRVLEKMKPPWWSYTYDKYGIRQKDTDQYFCERARNYGFRIHTFTKKVCGQVKELELLELVHTDKKIQVAE